LLACGALFLLAQGRSPAAAPPDRARTDCYGDPLPPGAVARIGTVRWRHVNADYVAWVGKDRLASVARGEMRLWDVKTGRLARPVKTGQEKVLSSALSPDGKLLALSDMGRTISLHDAHTGRPLRRIKAPWDDIRSLAFSRDGKRLAARSRAEYVGAWDVATGKAVTRFERPQENDLDTSRLDFVVADHSLAFSPDGDLLAAASEDGLFCVWRATTGKLLFQKKGQPGRTSGVAFSPDGNVLAWGKDGAIHLVAPATGKELLILRGAEGHTAALAFSPDGKRLASAAYDMAHLWDPRTGKHLHRLEGNFGGVSFVAFSPDGKTLAAATECRVRRWDVATGKELAPHGGDLGPILDLAVSADGKNVATSCLLGPLALWGASTGKALRCLDHSSVMGPLTFFPDGTTLAAANEERVLLWGVNTGKSKALARVRAGAWELAVRGDGKALVAAVGADGSARVWPLAPARPPRLLAGLLRGEPQEERFFGALRCALSAHGCCLAAWSRSSVQTGSVFSGRRHPRFSPFVMIRDVAVSPDGRKIAVVSRPWPPEGEPEDARRPVVWYVEVVEVATAQMRCRWSFRALNQDIHGPLKFGAEGRSLAFTIGDEAHVREAETGKELALLRGHQGKVNCLAFSADGRLLVSGSDDTTALVWELPRQERAPRADLPPHRREALWFDLAGEDAVRAGRAITALSRERSAAFLEGKLRQEARASARRYARFVRLTADLASADFTTREKATQDLREGADEAEAALHRALAGKLDLEARLRLTKLLAERDGAAPPAGWARIVRALEALERMGGPEPRQALEAVAREGEGPLAEEARAALARLAARA
jgi:WD40 repeat protein